MKNILLIVSLLLLASFVGWMATQDYKHAGCIGLSAVFAFTGIGHFIKCAEMEKMIPPQIHGRRCIVVASGIFELLLAAGLSSPAASQSAARVAVAFLILALPLNIYSAIARVPFGGHGIGPRYLWLRIPLQAALVVWAYLCSVR